MRDNTGIRVWNDAPLPGDGRATVAITGAGRAGTTMLARITAALGIEMGDALAPGTAEDKPIQLALKARDMTAFAERVAEMNAMADRRADHRAAEGEADREAGPKPTPNPAPNPARGLWAFKCPALRGQMAEALPLLRAPRLVTIFRDPVAVAERNLTRGRPDPDLTPPMALDMAARTQAKFATRLAALDLPVLLVSYEKALARPEALVTALAGFCGVRITPEEAARIAAAEIDPADPRYGKRGDAGNGTGDTGHTGQNAGKNVGG